MTCFLRLCLGLTLCAAGRPTLGQHTPERATFVGLMAGTGMALTPASPSYLDLDGAYIKEHGQSIGPVLLLGAFLRLQRGAWFAQPELRYQNVYSGRFAVSGGGGGSGYGSLSSGRTPTVRFHVRQLAGSLLGGYRFGSQQQFYGLLGPALAWRWGTDEEPVPVPSYSVNSKSDYLDYAVDQAPAAMQLQLHGALGYWEQHFGLEARFVYGLTPLVRRLPVQEQTYDFRVRSRLLLVSVGYRFGRAYGKP